MFRFNFSHGTQEDHRRYNVVREIEREVGRPIAILADMPKLRIGKSANGKICCRPAPTMFDRDLTDGSDKRVLPTASGTGFDVITAGQSLPLDDKR